MEKDLTNIVNMITTNFSDPHPRVRWAAINTVGQMSTDFGPGLQTKLHATVLTLTLTLTLALTLTVTLTLTLTLIRCSRSRASTST